MINWLTDNAVWIGTIAAIVTVVAFAWTFLKRDKVPESRKNIVAKEGSIATDGGITNSTININSTNSGNTDD